MAASCSRLGKMPLLYCSECLLFILCISTDMSNLVCSIRPNPTSIVLPQLHPSSTVDPQLMQVAMTVSEPVAIIPVQPDPLQPETVIAVISESNHVISEPYTSATNLNKSFNELIPLPKSARNCHSKRAVAHAKVITASPYKRKLEEAFTEKNRKMDAKKKRLQKRIEKALEKTSTIEGGKPSSKKQSNPKKAKNPASTKKVKSKSPASDANENDYDEANDSTPCLFCEIPYNESKVPWSQCPSCKQWLCDTCKHIVTEKQTGNKRI